MPFLRGDRLRGQIAAVAAVNDLVLVTDDTADFEHFTGLRLENWLTVEAVPTPGAR